MKLESLTRQAKKQYRQAPGQCPYCGHQDLVYGDIEMTGQEIMQTVACPACLRTWIDYYGLTNLIELDPVCHVCDGPIVEGDEVVFTPEKGYRHSTCDSRKDS